jgi:hypothetical protein
MRLQTRSLQGDTDRQQDNFDSQTVNYPALPFDDLSRNLDLLE